MGALQVIFVALICLAIFAWTAFNICKIVYAVKTKGDSLRPKGGVSDSENDKEEVKK